MDSMRSLNSSLLASTSKRRKSNYPPAELMQAFKTAAYSVTQLYKAAAADEDSARTAGYQTAIDELLAFLDSENLGLGDGEGWRVRQWATERLTPDAYASSSEDEAEDDRASHKERGESERQQPEPVPVPQERVRPQPESSSSVSTTQVSPQRQPDETPRRRETFNFAANQQMPDTDMTGPNGNSNVTPSSLRLNLRTALRSARKNRSGERMSGAASADGFPSLGHGAGSKRKTPPQGDVFDFAGFGKDMNGHGHGAGGSGNSSAKRGRCGE